MIRQYLLSKIFFIVLFSLSQSATAKPIELSVADVFKKKSALLHKQIQVEGKVVKVNRGILGLNWYHIQDGSGDPAKKNHNLTFTTKGPPPKVGMQVVATGYVDIDKKYGPYAYSILMYDASFKVQ